MRKVLKYGRLANPMPPVWSLVATVVKYWVSKAQWEWAVNPNNREKASFLSENIMPMQESGQMNVVENEGEIYPDFLFDQLQKTI